MCILLFPLVYVTKISMILAVVCPTCGQQFNLRAAGPEGILKLPTNLYVDLGLASLEQKVTYGVGDQKCSKCKIIGSTSLCQHCLEVNMQHFCTTYS